MIGWGIIGIGDIADGAMAPAIRKLEDGRLVGVVSRDIGRAAAFAKKHGAEHAYSAYDDLLRNADVDVVLITTPNALHADQVVEAARAGKHVLCDKPLATSVADAERAMDACLKADVKLGVNFQTRYYTPMQELRRLIQTGELGEVITIQADASPGARGLVSWRADQKLAGLGSVNNIAVHIYDILRFLLGAEVTEVYAMFDTKRGSPLETQVLALLRFDNGTLAFANCNQNTPNPRNDMVVYGTRGRVVGVRVTRENDAELQVLLDGAKETAASYNTYDAWDRLVAAFNRAILANHEPDPSGVDGLRSVQLTEAIAKSARDGELVHPRY